MSGVGRDYLKYAVLLIAAAFSTLPAFAATLTVTTLGDDTTPNDGSVSLREAIAAVNAGNNLGDPDIIAQNPGTFGVSDTIVFQPGLTGTIPLASGVLVIKKNLTISGPGASILAVSGSNSSTVFSIFPGNTVFISGLTTDNGSNTIGGGILNHGKLTLTNCVISGNTASNQGGGIQNYSTLIVTNSTISGNTATNSGGGIYNNSTAIVTVTNSTISGNITVLGGGIYNNGGTATLKSTILANESAISGGNCSGAITSAGYNLSDDTTCSFTQTGDLNNTPAGLDPSGLENNGGPTPTIALLPTSPAVDAIPVSACTDQTIPTPLPVTTDQRGVTRPQGPACDIGAYEFIPDAFKIRYASNLNMADSVVNITNTGASATGPIQQGPPNSQVNINGSICVNIYAFAADEQEVACCSCLVTPNALWSASVKTALLNSTLTPSFPNEVIIKLISTVPLAGAGGTATCNAAAVTGGAVGTPGALANGLLAWGTSAHGFPTATGPTFSIAETPFVPASLSATELARDVQECQFIQVLGSGQFGICKGCTNVGLGAAAQ